MSTDLRAATSGNTASQPVLSVDWLRCVGHGVCAAAFGERIGRDEWGYPNGVSARGIPITPADRAAARMAVRTCPAAALRLDRRS